MSNCITPARAKYCGSEIVDSMNDTIQLLGYDLRL